MKTNKLPGNGKFVMINGRTLDKMRMSVISNRVEFWWCYTNRTWWPAR